MNEPKIFYVTRNEISMMNVALPSGKIITFKQDTNYSTTSDEEVDFLSSVKGLGCRNLNDAEFRGWATTRFEELPRVTKEIKTVEDVAEFLWKDPVEKLILMHLQALGYEVYPPEQEDTEEKPVEEQPDHLADVSNVTPDTKATTKTTGKKGVKK